MIIPPPSTINTEKSMPPTSKSKGLLDACGEVNVVVVKAIVYAVPAVIMVVVTHTN